MATGEGMIGKQEFENMIEEDKVKKSTSGKRPVIYQIWELLKRNAVTKEAMMENLGINGNTITNSINHLKQRKNLNIERYFNKDDGKFYYYLNGTLG